MNRPSASLPLFPVPLAGLTVVALALAAGPAGAAVLPTDFADQLVVSGLDQPTSFVFLPDGRVVITEQNTADVELVVNGSLAPAPILHVADVNTSGGERGLLGAAVDPGWPARPYLYFYFDRTPGNVNYVSRWTASGDLTDGSSTNLSLGDRYDILTDIPDNASNHNGGTLRFGPDGLLYVSVGDDADQCEAQDLTSLQGAILRLDVSGLPPGAGGPPAKTAVTPAANPFTGGNANAGLIYCYGLRNPFRFHVDRWPGRIYIGDVGLSTYEEEDEARAGDDLGWPWREGPLVRAVSACPEPGGSGTQSFTDPIAYYLRSSGAWAIIGGPIYRPVSGGAYTFPALYDGAVFYADYYNGFVRAIKRANGTWGPLAAVPGQPNATDWATGIANVGDFGLGPDGAIYYVQQFPGSLRRIVYTGTVTAVPGRPGSGGAPWIRAGPNPFFSGGPPVRVEAAGAGERAVRIGVWDVSGRRVRAVYAGDPGASAATARWDGRDDAGRPVSPGMYYLRVEGPKGGAATRVVLLP
jgi:glucose/arabinose dehydrogenase